MTYRIVIGEKGNTQGHIINTSARTERGAQVILGKELAKYKGDGWGRVEEGEGDNWEKIESK